MRIASCVSATLRPSEANLYRMNQHHRHGGRDSHRPENAQKEEVEMGCMILMDSVAFFCNDEALIQTY